MNLIRINLLHWATTGCLGLYFGILAIPLFAEDVAREEKKSGKRHPLVERIRSYDKDGDDRVSLEESSVPLKERYFARIDIDKNGFLDQEELNRFEKTISSGKGGKKGRQRRVRKAITDAPTVKPDEIGDGVTAKELVIGAVVEGKAKAYPINMLTGPSREIINDKLGGRAIAATW